MIEYQFDAESIQFIQSFSSPLLDFFFQIITQLGNPVFWLIISAYLYWIGKEKASLYLTNLILFTAVFVETLKLFFARPRPEFSGESRRILGIETNSKYSFPSGHAALISSVTAFYASRKKLLQTIGMILLIILVGASRLYLGVHFLSDVLAGIVLGIIVAGFNKHVSRKLDDAKLKLTKLNEEFLILFAFIASILVLTVSQSYTISAMFFGYYVGLFMIRETGYKCTQLSRQKTALKIVLGFDFIAVFAWLAISSIEVNFLISYLMFLILGLWVSMLYPLLFERMILKFFKQ